MYLPPRRRFLVSELQLVAPLFRRILNIYVAQHPNRHKVAQNMHKSHRTSGNYFEVPFVKVPP